MSRATRGIFIVVVVRPLWGAAAIAMIAGGHDGKGMHKAVCEMREPNSELKGEGGR